MTLLREVVLPVGLASAGVLLVLIAAARRGVRLSRGVEIVHRPVPAVAQHLAATALGGFAVLLAAMSAYCGTRGVPFGDCILEPVRGAGLLVVIAVPALLAIEVLARLRR